MINYIFIHQRTTNYHNVEIFRKSIRLGGGSSELNQKRGKTRQFWLLRWGWQRYKTDVKGAEEKGKACQEKTVVKEEPVTTIICQGLRGSENRRKISQLSLSQIIKEISSARIGKARIIKNWIGRGQKEKGQKEKEQTLDRSGFACYEEAGATEKVWIVTIEKEEIVRVGARKNY